MRLRPGTAAAILRELTPEPERVLPSDPAEWVAEECGEFLWSKQREIMRAVKTHRRVAVPSAHGTGKSRVASRIAAWWIAAHPLGEAAVITTAPTGDQVKGILWQEIASAKQAANLPGTISGITGQGPVLWHIGDVRVGVGRKPQDLANPEQAMQAFQGFHRRYLLGIMDEATGVPPWLVEAMQALLTNEAARLLAIGNPDDPATWFERACRPGSGWHVMPVSAFDTPAFTGEPVPENVRDGLVSQTWVNEKRQDYGGEDNPLWQSKVLGQFPDTSDRNVIAPRVVREAQERDLPGLEPGCFGLDVSRSAKGDWTELYRWRGGVARLVDRWRGLDSIAAAERAWSHGEHIPNVPIVVDNDGLGVSVADALERIRERLGHSGPRLVRFSSAGAPREPDKFDTRRSELWWTFRELVSSQTDEAGATVYAGHLDLDAADERLAAQLQAPRWWPDRRGRIHVETKDEMARRGEASPDAADAVMMAALSAPKDVHAIVQKLVERRVTAKPGRLAVGDGEVARVARARW
jgi:hypothetical protein